jgi:hypothetical protein
LYFFGNCCFICSVIGVVLKNGGQRQSIGDVAVFCVPSAGTAAD